MTPGVATDILRAGRSDSVREIEAPASARALATLARIDYEDAFLVEAGRAHGRTGEQWARAILEDAPFAVRRTLLAGWAGLGAELGPTRSDGFVLGWTVRRSTADHALLHLNSRFGLAAELLLRPARDTLLFATFVHKRTALARAVWVGVEPVHREAVRFVLGQAAARARRS
jgi:hypothetical protein